MSTQPTTTKRKNEKQQLQIKRAFKDFVLMQDHPCIMAQSVFKMGNYRIRQYSDLGSDKAAGLLLSDIKQYLQEYDFSNNEFFTFIAAFLQQERMNENEFEQLLWKQLNEVHKIDTADWNQEVSADPNNENFSFSIAGEAFYIVGMHPGSSRAARQSPYPCLVFNLHWQFEKLREMGSYDLVKEKIRQRDLEKNGSMNPMLEDFGEGSEARQYSGRAVSKEWKCPFHAKQHKA